MVNEEQTWKLAELIKKFGKEKVLVGLVLRYSKHARLLRELINNNRLGKFQKI